MGFIPETDGKLLSYEINGESVKVMDKAVTDDPEHRQIYLRDPEYDRSIGRREVIDLIKEMATEAFEKEDDEKAVMLRTLAKLLSEKTYPELSYLKNRSFEIEKEALAELIRFFNDNHEEHLPELSTGDAWEDMESADQLAETLWLYDTAHGVYRGGFVVPDASDAAGSGGHWHNFDADTRAFPIAWQPYCKPQPPTI